MNHPALCNAVAVIVNQHVFNPQPARSQAVVFVIYCVVFGPRAALGAAAPVVFVLSQRSWVVGSTKISSSNAFEPHLLDVR